MVRSNPNRSHVCLSCGAAFVGHYHCKRCAACAPLRQKESIKAWNAAKRRERGGTPRKILTDAERKVKEQERSAAKHDRQRFGGFHATVLQRDKHTCQECGAIDDLCVHHRDGDDTHHALDNLTTLCRACHMREHARMTPERWVQIGKMWQGRKHRPESRAKMSAAKRRGAA